jgi:hypothetical protein
MSHLLFLGAHACILILPFISVMSDSEITYEDSSVTEGLFIALNEENKVATQCWLHAKSPECRSSTRTEPCPCMVNWPNENNVVCIRFSPIEQCVASAMFQRKGTPTLDCYVALHTVLYALS